MRVQRQRHLYSIFDSKASPAGLSNVLWKPGRSDDYDIRETQVCRAWDVELGIELPLLPLKNTISASEDQDSKQANSRRMQHSRLGQDPRWQWLPWLLQCP